jgi:predicted dehydrogenase
VAVFDFGSVVAIWDGSSCHPRTHENLPFVAFYGEGGALTCSGGGDTRIFDRKGKEVSRGSGPGGDQGHIRNFLDCIRTGGRPNAEIEDGQKSTLLCHLGNIAYRTGRTLHLDPTSGRIVDDPEAQALWRRDYRPGWEPRV